MQFGNGQLQHTPAAAQAALDPSPPHARAVYESSAIWGHGNAEPSPLLPPAPPTDPSPPHARGVYDSSAVWGHGVVQPSPLDPSSPRARAMHEGCLVWGHGERQLSITAPQPLPADAQPAPARGPQAAAALWGNVRPRLSPYMAGLATPQATLSPPGVTLPPEPEQARSRYPGEFGCLSFLHVLLAGARSGCALSLKPLGLTRR